MGAPRPTGAHYALAFGFVMIGLALVALVVTVASLIYAEGGSDALVATGLGIVCIAILVRVLAGIIASWD